MVLQVFRHTACRSHQYDSAWAVGFVHHGNLQLPGALMCGEGTSSCPALETLPSTRMHKRWSMIRNSKMKGSRQNSYFVRTSSILIRIGIIITHKKKVCTTVTNQLLHFLYNPAHIPVLGCTIRTHMLTVHFRPMKEENSPCLCLHSSWKPNGPAFVVHKYVCQQYSTSYFWINPSRSWRLMLNSILCILSHSHLGWSNVRVNLWLAEYSCQWFVRNCTWKNSSFFSSNRYHTPCFSWRLCMYQWLKKWTTVYKWDFYSKKHNWRSVAS